jgi:hypothetical protein
MKMAGDNRRKDRKTMSVQEQILEAIRLEIAFVAATTVDLGELGATEGLALVPDGSEQEDECTLGHGGTYAMDITLTGKHENQTIVRDTMYLVHEHINHIDSYISGIDWAVFSIATKTAPEFTERDGNYWVYGSVFTIKYYIE